MSRTPGGFYPLELPFSYLALRDGHVIQRGQGETIEIGSTRIRVKPIDSLSPATTDIVMSIAWPARLNDGPSLQFVVQTKPRWDGVGLAECVILRHEFRIASKGNLGLGLRIALGAGSTSTRPLNQRGERVLPPIASGQALEAHG
jgi:hypothetical protein